MEEQKELKSNNLREIFGFVKKHQNIVIYLLLLGIIIYSGIYIRTLDFPTLRDMSTGNLTLAQDLDPFLYLRWAKEILINGSLHNVDHMRYVPLGYNVSNELTLPAYITVYLYKFMHLFSNSATIELAAILYSPIFFCLFLVAYFLFISKIFSKNPASKWIAIISTAIVSIIPGLLHRTLSGVLEKESAGLFFMFLSLYFMACFLGSQKPRSPVYWKALLFGSLAGMATGLMGLVWGGVMAMFLIGPAAMILIFFLCETDFNDTIFYICWTAGFTAVLLFCTTKYGMAIASPVVAGFAYFVILILLIKPLVAKKGYAVLGAIGIVILGILILNPHFNGKTFFEYIATDAYNLIITPFSTNRLAVTVAENQLAYVGTWIYSFGSAMFWSFLLSLAFIAYEAFAKPEFGKWGKLSASGFFVLSVGMIMSKYSPEFSSNEVFFACLAYFIFTLVMLCIKKQKEAYADKGMILFISALLFSIFCGRSVIRMFYFIYPFVPIAVSFMLIKSFQLATKKNEAGKNDGLMQVFAWAALGCLIFAIPTSLYTYNNAVINEARYSGTNYYSAQWQYAMSWVRANTSENAVFAHWWDYGYWVQTIGQRATILDGGNAISYWDYLMGRTLTQDIDNETFAFEFLKTHKADYLLIDSTDIGKYPAYSTIGSNANYDRASQITTFILNPSIEKETRNQTISFYIGGGGLEDDIVYDGNIYPAGTPIIGLAVAYSTSQKNIEQAMIIIYYQNQNIYIPVNSVYIDGNMISLNSSSPSEEIINGCIYLMPQISQNGFLSNGAALWLSPRLMKSTVVNLYLLNKQISGYNLVHSEQSPVISQMSGFFSQYNIKSPEVAYYPGFGGIMGPIKIWAIDYSAHPEANDNPEYLSMAFPESEGHLK